VAHAGDLVTTDAERACLAALRGATGDPDGPMERHCVRQFLIAEHLGEQDGMEVDRELLLCAALLHDAGLYPSVATGGVYVTDSRRLAERTLAPFGWPPRRLARCLDAVEQHHALRSRLQWGAEVELMRRSDLVDVTRGLVRFGLPRSWLRELRARRPGRLLPRARGRGPDDDAHAPAHARAHLLAAIGAHRLTEPLPP
jgi:hypothetical protein